MVHPVLPCFAHSVEKTQKRRGGSGAKLDGRFTSYINSAFTVDLPEYGDLTQTGWDWTGMGFRATSTTSSLLTAAYVTGSYGGATGCDNVSVSPSTLLSNCFGSVSEGDPDGAYRSGATDIAIGNGGFPFGLAFGRQYSSHRRLTDGPLGLGWTHNYQITAKVASDSFLALASESAIDAAAQVVSLYVTRQTVLDHPTTANLCETWLIDQMKDNIVNIKQGASVMRFVKKADDTYNPPPGQALKLTTVSGNFRLKNSKGIFYDFDSSGNLDTWSDASGNVVDCNRPAEYMAMGVALSCFGGWLGKCYGEGVRMSLTGARASSSAGAVRQCGWPGAC